MAPPRNSTPECRLIVSPVSFILSRAERNLCIHDGPPHSATVYTDTVAAVLCTVPLLPATAISNRVRFLCTAGCFASDTIATTSCSPTRHDTPEHLPAELRCTPRLRRSYSSVASATDSLRTTSRPSAAPRTKSQTQSEFSNVSSQDHTACASSFRRQPLTWSRSNNPTEYVPLPLSACIPHAMLIPQAKSLTVSRTWTCDVALCTSSTRFTRLADLRRHQATVHGMGTPEFPCTIPHCSRVGNKGFTRRDHLMEHLRNFHKVDVPKRKAGERSAFPFGWPEGMGGEGRYGK